MKTVVATKKSLVDILIIVLLIVSTTLNILFVIDTKNDLYDFGSFIASGKFENRGTNPYSGDSPLIFFVKFSENGPEGKAPNLNPPISVLIFKQFAEGDLSRSILIWRISSIVLFFVSLLILFKEYPQKGRHQLLLFLWAVSLAGFWHTIQLGQLYSLLLLLVVLIYVFFKKKKLILSGIVLGVLIAIKPNFIFWAILLLCAGNWRTFLSAGITASAISAVPLITDGTQIYKQWIEASNLFTPDLLIFPGNNSFQGLTARFDIANMGIILSILMAAGLLYYVVKRKPRQENLNSLGVVSSLLISPIAWTGYTILTLPYFFGHKKWNWIITLSAVIFAVPFMIPLSFFTVNFSAFIFFGWFYGWGLISLLAGILISDHDAASTEEITSSIQTN